MLDSTQAKDLHKLATLIESGINVTLTTGDIEIGAVEIKNATTDTRAVVLAASTAATATDTPLVVAIHPSSPLPTGTNAIGNITTLTTLTSGNTGGFTSKIAFSPATSATAYTANDNIGGIITLTSLLRTSGGTALLDTISIWLLGNAVPNLYIDFWDASPSGTYTNDAAQVIAGDQLKWLGMVEIAVSDWKQTGVISRCTINPPKFGLKGNASANIYMTIQDKTGVTLGSTAGLFGYVTCLQD